MLMIVSTSPLRIPWTGRRSLSTATTLYCCSKIDVSAPFIKEGKVDVLKVKLRQQSGNTSDR